MKKIRLPKTAVSAPEVARADSRAHPRIDAKPEPFGLTTLFRHECSQENETRNLAYGLSH